VKHQASGGRGIDELADAATVVEVPVAEDESVGSLNGLAKSPGVLQKNPRATAVEQHTRVGRLDPEREPPLRPQSGRTLGVVDQDPDADIAAGHEFCYSSSSAV
jgi:hypothetical protein